MLKSNRLVSVIMATYKRPVSLIRRALDSAVMQTYRPIEIIIVDDDGEENPRADDIKHMINDITASASIPIRYIAQQTRGGEGCAKPKNVGIRYATGGYIAFLDDDDLWRPDKLESQLGFIDGFDFASTAIVFTGHDAWPYWKPGWRRYNVSLDDLLVFDNRLCYTSSLLFKSDCLLNHTFDENLIQYDDWDLCLRLVQKGFKMGAVNKGLTFVSMGRDITRMTVSFLDSLKDCERSLLFFDKHREILGPWRYSYYRARHFMPLAARSDHKLKILIYGIRHAGWIPMASAFVKGICNLVANMMGRFFRKIKTDRAAPA